MFVLRSKELWNGAHVEGGRISSGLLRRLGRALVESWYVRCT